MADRVRHLAAPARLEVRRQVEPALVVVVVTEPAEGHDAVRVVAPAERPINHVCRVAGRRLTHKANFFLGLLALVR